MTLFDPSPLDGGLDLRSTKGLVALMGQPGIGATKAVGLAKQFGNWPTMAAASESELAKVGGKSAAALAARPEPEGPDLSSPAGVRAVGFFDPDFPVKLREIPSPPAVLWVAGTLPSGPAVAVVGTRHPTGYGVGVARLIAESAVERGVGVVSGLALGIDTIAHEAALSAGGKTWAVLGGGVDVPTPESNIDLAGRIVEGGGGLIAEVPPGTPTSSHALVARDRLQSALSRAVVIAQSGVPSGTLHTARFAIDQGRLLAVAKPPASLAHESESAGNLALTDIHGCDPAILKASGPLARRIAGLRPVAGLVLGSRDDLPALWERVIR